MVLTIQLVSYRVQMDRSANISRPQFFTHYSPINKYNITMTLKAATK